MKGGLIRSDPAHFYGLTFFRPCFHCCLSNIHYCEDRFHTHFLNSSVHMYDFHTFTVINVMVLSDHIWFSAMIKLSVWIQSSISVSYQASSLNSQLIRAHLPE